MQKQSQLLWKLWQLLLKLNMNLHYTILNLDFYLSENKHCTLGSVLNKKASIEVRVWVLGPPLVELSVKDWDILPYWKKCVIEGRLWDFKSPCHSQFVLCLCLRMWILIYCSRAISSYLLRCSLQWWSWTVTI